VLSHQLSLRREEQHGAIQRVTIAFNDTNNQLELIARRDFAELATFFAGHIDRLLPIFPEFVSAFVEPLADGAAERSPAWVAADVGFGEEQQLRLSGRCLLTQLRDAADGVGFVCSRRSLRDGDHEWALDPLH
jgi:hypothetical protein